ncbi:MAG: UDP-N-acetylmuramoyl-tripeptide--D-alanyl-D-alanine ligase [Melioribacteraceae bacterium]|nr:UDP-N-acetylmuramoyl-tripeptide--D-alanyl-D-alanine ligase [Melioribacteraceae bacterium]
MKITLEDIFNIPSAVIYYPEKYKSVTSVSIDTRTLKKNSIYVAIKGLNFDGHDFVEDALKKGAKAIIVSNRKLSKFENVTVPIISVKNTLEAYGVLAGIWRNKHNAKVISITGSNGKTTTKEILAHLLEVKYKVHKTYLNNNNQIGVPLTILSAPDNTEFIILEHGTNHFGEIKFTAKIAQPDLALITNIGNSHIQYLESKEKILEEKIQLFNHIKMDGTVFINSDDPLLKSRKKNYKNSDTYGFKGKVDIKGKIVKGKASAKLEISGIGKTFAVSVPLLGEANLKNYLSAVSIAAKCGLTKKDIIHQSKTLTAIKGRVVESVYKDYTIIDDTYNSNPESVKSAIKFLQEYKLRKNKILVIGDMLELGKRSTELHKDIASYIDSSKVDELYTIGKKAKLLFENTHKIKIKKHFTNRGALISFLNDYKINDSIILFKGSRGMRMEEFLAVLANRVT